MYEEHSLLIKLRYIYIYIYIILMLVALERYSVKGIPEFMRNFPLIILIYIYMVSGFA
jgi:hypothetical protein